MQARVFLSYARGEDEPFVARLHADLTARGFGVWWDCTRCALHLENHSRPLP